MNIKQLLSTLTAATVTLSVAGALALTAPGIVHAAENDDARTKECGGVATALIDCKGTGKDAIIGVLAWFIRIFTVIIGIVAVGAIVYASIVYSSAHDNEQQVSQAKGIIRNVVIGLILYALMFSILNFLVPGGVIG